MMNTEQTQDVLMLPTEDEVTPSVGKPLHFKKSVFGDRNWGGPLWRRMLLLWAPIAWLELVFHLMAFKDIGWEIVFPLVFAAIPAALFALMSELLPRTVTKTVLWVILPLLCLLFSVQLIYRDQFQSFLSWGMVRTADDIVTDFIGDVFRSIFRNLFNLVLLWLPLPAYGVMLHAGLLPEKRQKKWMLPSLSAVGGFVLAILLMLPGGFRTHTPFNLYFRNWVPDLSMSTFGMLTTTVKDVWNLMFGSSDVDIVDVLPIPSLPESSDPSSSGTEQPPIQYPDNVMDIDFAALAATETNEKLKELHQYFAAVQPTKQNEYTGMFEGYNLILLCAESFSPYVVSEELTPTLYRMTNEGFVFTDYYTTFPAVTTDGEYTLVTGLLPHIKLTNKWSASFEKSQHNWLPFSLGHQFGALGLSPRAYHNHRYNFYNRYLTHPNLGYDFKAKGLGLPFTYDWPESDLDMMKDSVKHYLTDLDENGQVKQFHTYYMTVSGHKEYVFGANDMADKNKHRVKDLPYSNAVKAYIACHLELEDALTYLIQQLEEAGVADKTVIALTTDHYPYGLSLDQYSELAGFEVDEKFGKYKNSFILWNPGMEESITVNEPCCTMDILPTLSNLFGLEYDSRLLMGTDILSDSTHIAVLRNQSFITDILMYDSETREITMRTDAELSEDYIEQYVQAIQQMIVNKFAVSSSILDNDYYASIIERPSTSTDE